MAEVAQHYEGEPAPAEMIHDLQRALYGKSYATPHPPQEEWRVLLQRVEVLTEIARLWKHERVAGRA